MDTSFTRTPKCTSLLGLCQTSFLARQALIKATTFLGTSEESRHFIEGELLAANEVDAQGMHERTLGGLLNGSIGRLDFSAISSLP